MGSSSCVGNEEKGLQTSMIRESNPMGWISDEDKGQRFLCGSFKTIGRVQKGRVYVSILVGKTGNLECKATRDEESCSQMQKSILLDNKFTKFLKKMNNEDYPVDAKKVKNKEELNMMARSRIIKPDLKQQLKCSMWYLDNGCSRHMTGDPTKFSDISYKVAGHVTYGDNNKRRIISIAKNDTLKVFKRFAAAVQNEMDLKIKAIRSDHGGELQNKEFDDYLAEMGIVHNFSGPRTPKKNRVVERKNRALEELARSILKLTPHELLRGRKLNISHLRIFGSKCFVLNNDKENLGKFDSKVDEAIFIGYSLNNKAYRVYNKRTMNVEESIHVAFDEFIMAPSHSKQVRNSAEEDENSIDEETPREVIKKEDEIEQVESPRVESIKAWKAPRNVSTDNVIGDISRGVSTRRQLNQFCMNVAFLSKIEPKKVEESLNDENWMLAMKRS
ncbi:uncharacterized protein LOC111241023 [Vigna radiata var. radiata]|uniref:Uncharacterized protein LOC111241023 n=1 Tax=Vigna radiata var. radiata TaxID=3916 RepID=A0A3Q0EN54_VIGRR|nr:uncharacterized protein LOC111241023 [Vigna radiata var. radiata]